MLLCNLEEAGVVDAAVLLQLVDVLGDAVQLFNDLLQDTLSLAIRGQGLLGRLVGGILNGFGDGVQLGLAFGGAVAQLLVCRLVEVGDLLQLVVDQLAVEGLRILVGPGVVLSLSARLVLPQQLLELGVVDVRLPPRLVHGIAQRRSELHLARLLQLCKSPSVDLQKEEFLSPNQLVGRRNRKEPITVAGFSTPKNFNSSTVLQ